MSVFSNRILHRKLLPYKLVQRHKSINGIYETKLIEQHLDAINRNNEKLFPKNQRVTNKSKYNSILPPPNVTGNLHLGHALMVTVQDVICRWKHMNGVDVQWIPGTDHAGIATQVVVEQQMKRELGISRHDIGKEFFLQKILKWKDEKGNRIKDDIIKLGTLFNWEKEYFTMDEHQSYAVVEAFIRLFNENLIYRKEALVNWSCSLKSAISDIEVENVVIEGPTKITVPGYDAEILFGEIYNICYKQSNGHEEIVVATTRPETLLGDVAVAVNPKDERYSHLRNQNIQLWHPFRNEWIPLIFDELVDPHVGTGAVKITPAHSRIDYIVAQKHNLPILGVIDQGGFILNEYEQFAGLPRFIARQRILNVLANLSLFRSKAAHKYELPICSRSKDIVELLLKPQWFMRCDEMSQLAVQAVENGHLSIDPPRFENEWKRWLMNPMDWCLSRQIWWGHRIPAFECKYNDKSIWVAAHTKEEALKRAIAELKLSDESAIESITLSQDEDVLDTWFSSGILPFSVFGWPNVEDTSKNYPLDVLVTGHDILFFWVARMVMLSTHLTGKLPFQKVLLHGIVCDNHGKKMSKSRGNVVTPAQIINGASLEEMKEDLKKSFKDGILTNKELTASIQMKQKIFSSGIPSCGVDALRFTLCSSDIRDHFIEFNVKECAKNHRFFNKIWNATKFTCNNCDIFAVDLEKNPMLNRYNLTDMDRWILSRLAKTLLQTMDALNNLHVGCAHFWKEFFYENLCDVYLEASKFNFVNNAESESRIQCEILKTCLTIGLRHMGIFTPFLSNEILSHLPNQMEFKAEEWIDESLEAEVASVLKICAAIRQLKSEQNILRKHGPRTYLFSTDAEVLHSLTKFRQTINTLTFSIETIIEPSFIESCSKANRFILKSVANHLCSFGITTDVKVELIDINLRNKKKLAKLEEEFKEIEDKISNAKYQKRASALTKEKDLEKISKLSAEIQAITELIKL